MIIEYTKLIIATLIMFIGFWIGGDIVFEEKSRKDWKGFLILIVFSSIVALFNINQVVNAKGFIKILLVLVCIILFNKYKYKLSITEILIGSVIIYVNVIITDIILEIIVLILGKITPQNLISILRYTIISAILAFSLSLTILKSLKKKYLYLLKKLGSIDSKLAIVILIVFLVITIMSGIVPLKNLDIGIEIIVVALLMIGFSIIGLYIITERVEKDRILGNYKQLIEYAKVNENLLEDYRVSCHENKNHLIIIDNMIPKSNKKVHEYINSISQGYKMNKYYFINELKYIPIVELKGFINFKLMQMLNAKMNLQINVSPEIKNSKLTKLSMKDKEDLYNIVGVLLDNAYDASKESKEKEVVFQMYKEKTTIVLLIANTYKGTVDIERVSEYGYSSKGKNHGTGLYIVDKIINKNDRLSKETNIIDNYFVQTIKLK